MSVAVSSIDEESAAARLGRRLAFPPEEEVTAAIAGALAARGLLRDPATRGALTAAQQIEVCGRAIGEAVDAHRRAAADVPREVP